MSSLNAPLSTNKVSIFKLTIKDKFNDYFCLIRDKFFALALIISVTFFLGHPVGCFLLKNERNSNRSSFQKSQSLSDLRGARSGDQRKEMNIKSTLYISSRVNGKLYKLFFRI